MVNDIKYVTLAVNGGIGFGAKLKPKQLAVLGEYLEEDTEIELTTLQQLIVQIPEEEFENAKKSLRKWVYIIIKSVSLLKTYEPVTSVKVKKKRGCQ